MGLSVVRDLREMRAPAGPEEIERFETDVFAGFVLARCAAGLSDNTIRSDVSHLEQVRTWFGKPLWDMLPPDADVYFGTVLGPVPIPTRLARAQAIKTYFEFLELRHKVEIHNLTGWIVECPIDEINRPRGRLNAKLRIPPAAEQIARLFAGWRGEVATCRKFGPVARNYAAAKLMSEVGLRVNEARQLDLADIKWDLGRFGKLHVRHGKGARGSGPRERMVPLINGAGRILRWFVEDVWCQLGDDPARLGAPLFCSERRNADGTAAWVSGETLRAGLAEAAVRHLPEWPDSLTPHVLRHFCAGNARSLLGCHDDELHPCSSHARRGRVACRAGPRRCASEGTGDMRWNLRLAAANRGIWKASELQRQLADHGLVVSAGKMSGLWSGSPASIKLEDLDIICAVLGCGVEEILIPEPDKVNRPVTDAEPTASTGTSGPTVTPKRRDGRSLPPE